jgi:hypothetical protein
MAVSRGRLRNQTLGPQGARQLRPCVHDGVFVATIGGFEQEFAGILPVRVALMAFGQSEHNSRASASVASVRPSLSMTGLGILDVQRMNRLERKIKEVWLGRLSATSTSY